MRSGFEFYPRDRNGSHKPIHDELPCLGCFFISLRPVLKAENAFTQSAIHANLAGDDILKFRALVSLAEIARGRGDLEQAA